MTTPSKKSFYDTRDEMIRAECNGLRADLEKKFPDKSKEDLTADVLDMIEEKYLYGTPPLTRETVHHIWTHKNYRKGKRK